MISQRLAPTGRVKERQYQPSIMQEGKVRENSITPFNAVTSHAVLISMGQGFTEPNKHFS
jgi:hypothetical protein